MYNKSISEADISVFKSPEPQKVLLFFTKRPSVEHLYSALQPDFNQICNVDIFSNCLSSKLYVNKTKTQTNSHRFGLNFTTM